MNLLFRAITFCMRFGNAANAWFGYFWKCRCIVPCFNNIFYQVPFCYVDFEEIYLLSSLSWFDFRNFHHSFSDHGPLDPKTTLRSKVNIYIYTYVCVCLCVYVCMFVCIAILWVRCRPQRSTDCNKICHKI